MIFWDDAARAERRRHARGEMIRERDEFVPRARPRHAHPRVQKWSLGTRKQIRRALDQHGIARADLAGAILVRRPNVHRVRIAETARDVLRNFQIDRTWSSARRDAIRAANQFRQAFPIAHTCAHLGNRTIEINEVYILKRSAAIRINDVATTLTTQHDQRTTFGVRGDNAGDHVRRARSDATDNDGWFPAHARPRVRHVRRRRFVTRRD